MFVVIKWYPLPIIPDSQVLLPQMTYPVAATAAEEWFAAERVLQPAGSTEELSRFSINLNVLMPLQVCGPMYLCVTLRQIQLTQRQRREDSEKGRVR